MFALGKLDGSWVVDGFEERDGAIDTDGVSEGWSLGTCEGDLDGALETLGVADGTLVEVGSIEIDGVCDGLALTDGDMVGLRVGRFVGRTSREICSDDELGRKVRLSGVKCISHILRIRPFVRDH